jgi:hypothetical protein
VKELAVSVVNGVLPQEMADEGLGRPPVAHAPHKVVLQLSDDKP